MKIRLLIISVFCLSLFNVVLAETPAFIQTKEGIIVFTDPAFTGRVIAVKLEVIADNIIRVIAEPGKEIRPSESLITVYSKMPDISWNVISTKEYVTLKTNSLPYYKIPFLHQSKFFLGFLLEVLKYTRKPL